MNEQMTAVRTPQLLGAEIRNLTATAKYMTLWYAVEIGRRLTEAKELVKHGEWMDFLERETEFSSSSASRFMTVFREYGGGEKLNFPTLGNISVSNALRLLAVPEEERETFAETVDAAHISTKELEAAIKERDAALKREKELREEFEETSDLLDKKTDEYAALSSAAKEYRDRAEEAEQRVKELERRPIDVAVQEPDPAEIERRAKELAAEKAKAEQEKLREKLKAAEEKLAAEKEAAEKRAVEDAGPYKARTEAAEAEVAALKKQLAMSDEATVIFKLRFTEWQEAFKAAMAALVRLPEGTKEKCRGAILAQLDNWKEAV